MRFGDPRLPERFWSKVHTEPMSGCWLWTGGTRNGYGRFRSPEGPMVTAHRYLLLTYEPERSGLVIDHTCCNPGCVNPDHLEQVTPSVNNLRYYKNNGLKTHCKNGHEFTEENTRMPPGYLVCKACASAASRRWRNKNPNDERRVR